MQIQITGLHDLTLTDPIKDYVHKKIGTVRKNLEAFEQRSQKQGKNNAHYSSTTDIHITLSVEKVNNKMQHIAKAVVHLPGNPLMAEATSDDMYKSIDYIVPKIKKELSRRKGKFQNRDTGLLPHEHE